ncbi:MAG: 5-formyltetrahydrofolate cyclo-ligase [Magnetovibrio sp.]|nr:5-formyltetrahydrofolate cyclo-ligase [Magnetovibrio sp.]
MPNPPTPTLDEQKAALRRRAAETRAAAAAADGGGAAGALAEHLIGAFGGGAPGTVISGYLAIGDELDVAPALEAFLEAGYVAALPVVTGAGRPLEFRRWQPGMDLEPGPLRTRHPPTGAATLTPEILLVPMLAFDAAGYRIGWGGGFYDRTLAKLRAAGGAEAVGVGYAAQRVDKVPRDHHDARLDWIATETAVYRAGQET